MKIAYYNNRFPPSYGGTEVHLHLLTKLLNTKSVETTVFTTNYLNSDGYSLVPHNKPATNKEYIIRVNAIRLFGKDALTIPFGLLSYIKEINQHDIFHYYTYGYLSSILIAILKALSVINIPVIFQPHYAPNNTYPRFFSWLYYSLFGILLTRSAAAVVLLTQTYEKFFKKLGAKLIVHIPPAIPELLNTNPHISEELNEELGIPTTAKVILSLSRLTKGKGNHLLIDAISELKAKKNIPVHLIIAGQGGELENLREQAKILKVGDLVHFVSPVSHEQKGYLYKYANAFALVSYSAESFGITLVEAMRSGLPILASNYGAIPAVLANYPNKIVISDLSKESIASGIAQTVDKNKLSTKETQQTVEPFVVETIIEKHLSLYRKILDNERNNK